MVVKNREGDFCCFMCYYYTNLYLVVVVALSGAVFDVHYHSAHAKKLVCSATGVYAPKCHQNDYPYIAIDGVATKVTFYTSDVHSL